MIKNDIPQDEIYLFNIGEAQQAYATFGCHRVNESGLHRFLVWAPNAREVSVVGDFNGWDGRVHPMRVRGGSGVWELFWPCLGAMSLLALLMLGLVYKKLVKRLDV